MKRTGHYGIPIRLCILLSLFSVTTSLTPPRILYGGWTPIMPGHPFHFGSVRRKHLEQSRHQQRHPGERIPQSYQQTPVHEVEHHFEHHVEFVEPEKYIRPEIHPGVHDHAKGQHIISSSPNKDIHFGYQSHRDQPVRGHKISHGNNEIIKDIYPYYPQTAYDGHQAQVPVKGQHIVSPEHKTNKDIYNFNTPHVQKSVKEKHISYGHKSNKNIYDYYPPQSAYDGPHVQKPVKEQHITYGHKPKKNIFEYYPPQSAYDGPKQSDLDYKPVYFEIPRKPFDAFEIPKQNVPYIIPSVKDVPIKTLNLHDLRSVQNLGEKTFLRITPLDQSTLKTIGDTNLGAIQYLNQDSPKLEKYPVIKDSSGGTIEYPRNAQYAFPTYGKHNAPAAKQNYGISGIAFRHNSANIAKLPIIDNDSFKRRPLNPIETKNYRNPGFYTQNLQYNSLPLKVNTLPSISTAPIYPLSPSLYSNLKYPSKPFGIGKNILSPVVLGNSFANQVKKYLGPKLPRYKNQVLQPFYPKAPVPTSIYPYQPITKPLVHLTPLQTMPKLLPNNYLKMQTLYKDPGVVTSIRGSPALVEREVAIIHLPVTSGHEEYPGDKEYLYYTASTPESTRILDVENLNNRSVSTLNEEHVGGGNNGSSFSPLLEYGNYPVKHASVDSEESQRETPTSDIDDNRVDGKLRYHDSSEYIYVSGTGIRDDPEAKKQFFHAYYAPADHMPPPGYVRMTIQEFGDLFKNAEIRYVDKVPTNLSPQDQEPRSS